MVTDRPLLVPQPNHTLRPPDGTEAPHTFMLAPTSDGEFAATCSCGTWTSFGTYVSPWAPVLRMMHAGHLDQVEEEREWG